MAFKAVFIGINKHQDARITELTGAVRDASALHALFSDTFDDIETRLLVDDAATVDAVRESIDQALAGSKDDVVVITFAGHGTNGHQIVAFDTDYEEIGSSTIPMSELAEKFRASRARAVLCILDCCFSGEAPARVLRDTPRARAVVGDYAIFQGHGRFLLAAASPNQPCWEEPGSGHGLLTKSVIEVLTAGEGTIDLTAAVAEIVAKTRINALAIGEQQDPTFVGGVEGLLELPVLRRGTHWRSQFPDYGAMLVTANITDLVQLGVPQNVVDAWRERYPRGLNALQLQAINEHRVLFGQSLLTVAPTSTGKTFIGEMCAVKAAVANRKAVFLLPYRALVNEKYEDFSALYGPLGLRVIRCSGDFTDETGLLLSGRYDIALLTFEMFLAMAVGARSVLRHLGLIVVDEAQFITDPMRGIAVELLLTLIRAGASIGIRPQLIALSAVIGGVNDFDTWLGMGRLMTTERPVPLTEGVLDRSGTYQFRDADGTEGELQLLAAHDIRQRRNQPSSQDVIVPLVRRLIAAREKILVFRNTRGPAEGCANYLAEEMGLPPARAALDALSQHDLSSSGQKLRTCLAGGTAFHNSNLKREERVVVERSFRDPAGGIEVLAATTTLAAGINTPASTVILAEQEFKGEDGRPFTVAEYKNMAGRAGRLGFNETGRAIILADNAMQRRELFARYVRGTPEPILSSFAEHDIRTWIIRLLSQVQTIKRTDIPHLLASTFGGFLAQRASPQWRASIEHDIREMVDRFVALGLLDAQEDDVRLTLLGRACGESSLSFDSAMRLIETIRGANGGLSAYVLVGLVQLLPEADAMYTPVRKSGRSEAARITEAQARFGHTVTAALQRWVDDEFMFWGRCKRAVVIADWMAGVPIQDIESRYSIPFGGQIQQGDIARVADGTRFHLRSAQKVLAALLQATPEDEAAFDTLMLRLELGLPEDLLPLARAPLFLSRGETLMLAGRGIATLEQLLGQTEVALLEVFGVTRATQILRVIQRQGQAA